MSHGFVVVTNENGLSLDSGIGNDIELALSKPFEFTDVFVYCHGWWTNDARAMEDYNRFTIEFSAQLHASAALKGLESLSIGIHWPSTLTEDDFSLLNYAEALSFFTMEKRADTVGANCGEALLKFVLDSRATNTAPLRVRLVGHSFGCKVVCSALQQLAEDLATDPIPAGVTFDVVLLQAAFDADELETSNDYGGVAQLLGLRLLITRADADRALSDLYPKAHELAHLFHNVEPALGYKGPTADTITRFGGARQLDVAAGFDPSAIAPLTGRLIVANLTPLHLAHPELADPSSGHHSDVFHPEIYKLLSAFSLGPDSTNASKNSSDLEGPYTAAMTDYLEASI